MANDKFAVIKTGGKQYKVSEKQVLEIEKLPKKEGGAVIFDELLLYADGRGVEVGTPSVKVSVKGKVLEQGKGAKKIVYKYKRRKRYSVKKGHRQPYTKVEITEISKGAGTTTKTTKATKTAPKTPNKQDK